MTPSQAPVLALLADGTAVTVRELGPSDVSALLKLHRSLRTDPFVPAAVADQLT